MVVTSNGNVYADPNIIAPSNASIWVLAGNVFGSGPTPALHESWGQVKARYQNTPGMTVTPGADNK
jgi:hypothetical protein